MTREDIKKLEKAFYNAGLALEKSHKARIEAWQAYTAKKVSYEAYLIAEKAQYEARAVYERAWTKYERAQEAYTDAKKG